MIWYLLYPLRGTTEAPVLASTHPLRRLFTRYGRYVARNVLTTLLTSVAFALILVYPCPFLYTTDSIGGVSSLPHHVWTDAQPLSSKTAAEPDVYMRSIWVHGSYMQALNHDVLLGALELQDRLLGPTRDFDPRRQSPPSASLADEIGILSPGDRDQFHVVNGLTDQSWFFHSPLQYWAGSAEAIASDPDLVATVNEKKTQPTSVNVTLRHSIVFSGKHFRDRRLVAADALVITLIHMRDSPVSRQWERNAATLAAEMDGKWSIIPSDGHSVSSQLYEFQFRPLSALDRALLTFAYLVMLAYFVSSFSKLRAVKSRAGLFVTAWAQIAASMVSSLTVCAVFKIDLSRIPYYAYPLVLLAISLENSFRLINAVVATPADHTISHRIGDAFGETAHVAVASRAQNLLILLGLSQITFPGVSAFCTFAAVAIVFDFFYLSTFFLSVLSIDVQRTELSDALERAYSAKKRSAVAKSQARQSWCEALLRGRIALSTRIAGTIVILGFVLIAQWHFLEDGNAVRTLARALSARIRTAHQAAPHSSRLVDIHQARSPTSWLRLQDHETAREVINVVKPWAHSYTALVYDPIVFVLRGSDRVPHDREPLFLPAVYDFMHHELPRFVVVVLVVVALVRLFMNYLLWDEMAEAKGDGDGCDGDESRTGARPLLSVKSLNAGHALDIAMMAGSSDGYLVSAGLDRNIQVWNVRSGCRSRLAPDPRNPARTPFPVVAMAIDNRSAWLALLTSQSVQLWNLSEKSWGPWMGVDMDGYKPPLLCFDSTRGGAGAMPIVIIVRRNGTMAELDFAAGEYADYAICKSPLISAVPIEEKPMSQGAPRLSILTASKRSCIHQVTSHNNMWLSEEVKFPTREERDIQSLVAITACSVYLIVRLRTVDMVDLNTSQILHTFQTDPIQYRSLKFLRSRRRQTQCGSQGLDSLTLAYVSADTGDCILQTYLPEEEDEEEEGVSATGSGRGGSGGGTICFCDPRRPRTPNCRVWGNTRLVKRKVKDPGDWEVLSNGSVVGVRRRAVPDKTADDMTVLSTLRAGLRRRRQQREKMTEWPSRDDGDSWEVWVMTQLEKQEKTTYETCPLVSASTSASAQDEKKRRGGGGGRRRSISNSNDNSHDYDYDYDYDDDDDDLMISRLGPIAKVGSESVAAGFGKVVKVVSVGHERFDDGSAGDRIAAVGGSIASRRRRTGGGSRIVVDIKTTSTRPEAAPR